MAVTEFNQVDVAHALTHLGYRCRGRDDAGQIVGDFDIVFWSTDEAERSGWHKGHLSMDEIGWYHADIKPTEVQMINGENERLTQISDDDTKKQDAESIKTLAENAVQFTSEIKLVFTAIKNAQFTRLNTDATFTAVSNALNDASIGQGFRNVVSDAYNAGGVTVDLANIGAETASQKQRFNAFADYFFTSWAFMVMLGQ